MRLQVQRFIAVVIWLSGGALSGQGPDEREFSAVIGPLLRERCVSCHGRSKPEAGLSLTSRRSAIAKLPSGEFAIVPGRGEASELLRRVRSKEAGERMPPKGPALSDAEQLALAKWITNGAVWPDPWAYRELRPITPPAGSENPIDGFIQTKLLENGLKSSPPADRRILYRRLSYDLLGLPPTPEAVARFVADTDPLAYERLVDQLLTSPHFGERMARFWMDVVHFAESHGQDQDRIRENAWPYRDYLIGAFNSDLPFEPFIQQQIAGDVLFPKDPNALVATGFLAAGPWDESGLRDIQEDAIDRQIARVLDRDDIITTVIGTFLSTTVHCARCHDHKFDPISQADYFGLQAVFAATGKGERPYDADPQVAHQRAELLRRRLELPRLRDALNPLLFDSQTSALVAKWEAERQRLVETWRVLTPMEATSSDGTVLKVQADGSVLATGQAPERDTYKLVVTLPAGAWTALRLEVLTDPTLPHRGPGRQDNGNLHLSEWVVSLVRGATPVPIRLTQPRADFDQAGWTAAHAMDGNPATAWGIYPEVGKPHVLSAAFTTPIRSEGADRLLVELRQLHGGRHLIGRPRLSVTATPSASLQGAEPLPEGIQAILKTPAGKRDPKQRASLAEFVLQRQIDDQINHLPPVRFAYTGSNQFRPDGGFKPMVQMPAIHVLHRGDIRQPRQQAEPSALNLTPTWPGKLTIAEANDDGARRAALAKWISDRRNPLPWRSMANRLWQVRFGRGLIDTANDFGQMGATPTHPELLDWLALEFQNNGGSIKKLTRLLVTSQTYRQGYRFDAGQSERDADNRLLWRRDRRRLEAESVHDSLAFFAGKLDTTMGGPSVRLFHTSPGVHVTPVVNYDGFDVDAPGNYRRAVYQFLFRTVPDPLMESLDCPDSSQWTPMRNQSITALQALALLNDKFLVRQAEHVAERIQKEVGAEVDRQVERLFSLTLQRNPTPSERASFSRHVSQHGLASASRVLFNANEFHFVD